MRQVSTTDALVLAGDQFNEISNLFFVHSGIRLPETKILTVQSRLRPLVSELGIDSFSEYIEFLKTTPDASAHGSFFNALTTNTTSFYREPHHFEHLRNEILELVSSGKQEINIWSAGCSSGQEPYTIALILSDLVNRGTKISSKILATDINSSELATARSGRYPISQLERVPNRDRTQLKVGKKHFEFNAKIKDMISFRQLNMFEHWPINIQFDFIFCRNVMIYFEYKQRVELFEKFVAKLKPNGCLYLGHSESSHTPTQKVIPDGTTTFRRIK